MSLESNLQKLTQTLDKLIEAITRQTSVYEYNNREIPRTSPLPSYDPHPYNPLQNAPQCGVSVERTALDNLPAGTQFLSETLPIIPYEDVKTLTLTISKTASLGPAAAKGLLAEFGAANATKLAPEQYAEYLNKGNALLSAGV